MKQKSIVDRLIEVIPQYLRIHHKGKKKAISLSTIKWSYAYRHPSSKYFVLSYCSPTEFCDAIKAIRDDNILIGSCSNGYYWITTVEEAKDTIKYLEKPAKTRLHSAKSIRRGVMKRWNLKINI